MTAPTLDFATLSRFADHLESTARECGRVIMDIYESDFEVHTKADKSPVTAADEASEEIILKALKKSPLTFLLSPKSIQRNMAFPISKAAPFGLSML